MFRNMSAVLQIELDEEGREVELGKGAFGVVVKGRYRLSPVAVKRLINQTPEQQAQFLKEMAILRACRGSRYIVPFVGASLQPVSCWLFLNHLADFIDATTAAFAIQSARQEWIGKSPQQ